jgi:inosose dehydratase
VYKGVALSFVVYEQQGRERDLPAYLAEISVGGFGAVEMRLDKFFGSKESTEATAVALRVDNHKMYTGLVETELDEPDQAKAAATLLNIAAAAERAKGRDLEFGGVVLVPLAGERTRTDADVQRAAERVRQLAGSLQRRGVWLGLHNGAAESADGARIYQALLEQTLSHPNVGVAADVEWLHRGGADPAAFLAKYKDRLRTLHLRQSRDGIWAEDFGDGQVDYRAVDKVTRPLKQDLYLVVELNYQPETRQTRRLVDDLKLSRQYVRRIFAL